MRHGLLGLIMMLGLFSTFHSNTAGADLLEALIMPGPLIEGHAKHESSCGKCHSLFDQEKQTGLCLDCHEEIDRDIANKKGFHGRSSTIKNTECRSCHTDHIGRGVDITGLNRESFDHEMTDFKLTGRHPTVACDACHEAGKKFRETPTDCYGCHKDDDIHREALGKDCDSCHSTKQWKKTKFDHDETEFSLEGAHDEAACSACHLAESYKDTPTQCNDCHRIDDVHNQNYGTSCDDCHEPSEWKKMAFDHDRETDYPLRGKHKSALCSGCHKGDLKADKLDTDCNSCHAQEDIHRKRFGTKCDDCHSESGWKKSSFQHDKDTDYLLKGKHKKLSCESCHQVEAGNLDEARGCIDCHKSDDVHKGDAGTQCARCHNEQGWSSKTRFDHDLTNFPLIGLHTALPCEACHLSGKFQEASVACYDCHAADDDHSRRLGNACQICHTPNDWQLWQFDHDTQTDFVLDGKHQNLDCMSCHLAPLEQDRSLSTICADCHHEDDVHDGNFGSRCDRCHSTEDFVTPNIQN